MFDIVAKQGKHRNPWTGSGGMLLGTVEQIGDALKDKIDLKVGDKIATLVSLSLTPLRIDKIKEIRADVDQVDIDGKAILFESGIYAKIPADLPEKLALSALDVAGAPAQTAKLVKPGDTVLIIGAGGKSGMLCCYEAKKRAGVTGKVIGLCHSEKSTKRLQDLGFCDYVFSADATQPVPVLEKIEDQHPRHRDDFDSLHQGYRSGLLLLHGHQLYEGGSRSRGCRQRRNHARRQRIH